MALFFGGVPTSPDVDKLIKEFDAAPGSQISYEQVEQCIGVSIKEFRFRTVTNAWRKRVFREKLIQSEADGGVFKFLTADEACDSGVKGLWRIGRATGRLRVHVEAIDPAAASSDAKRDKINLVRRASHAMHEASQASVKTIAAPKPVRGVLRSVSA